MKLKISEGEALITVFLLSRFQMLRSRGIAHLLPFLRRNEISTALDFEYGVHRISFEGKTIS